MLSKKVNKIKEDIKYLKNIEGIYCKVSRVANGYDLLYGRFWEGLSKLENDINKIKKEEEIDTNKIKKEEEIQIKRHNRKQTKLRLDYGYTINTTPKL
jgi:hypothetical protein